jgi:hypothetical protein
MFEDGKYKRNPDVSWRTIEGQAVLILNKEGEVQVLNEVGTYVWENVGLPLEELARNIAETYEVPLDQARADAREFLETLEQTGALVNEG